MIPTEVREAAERCRTKWTATSKSFDENLRPHMAYLEDLSTLADYALSLIRPDDGEAIDETWLRSVGFSLDGSHYSLGGGLQVYWSRSLPDIPFTPKWLLFGAEIEPRQTRGDLRTLASVLGIWLHRDGFFG